MTKLDFLYDSETGDLVIQNGDFVIGQSDLLQAQTILSVSKGGIRQYPLIGENLNNLLGSNLDQNVIYNLIQKALKSDNMELDDFAIGTNGEFEIKLKR